jgi:uncharacterized protein YbjT (DUF2867 family)
MILVTGATGFVGRYVLKELESREEPVRLFVRESSDLTPVQRDRFEIVYGSFEDRESVRRAFTGVKTLINIPNLIKGYVDTIIAEAQAAGVERSIFISTTAIFTTLPAWTKQFRHAAEEAIRNSGLQPTIVRPTMIYGDHSDGNIARLVRYMTRYPMIPIAGNGEWLQQPIHVADLAQAIVNMLDTPQTVDKEYNLGGATPLSYNDLLDTTARALGKRVYKMHIPVGMILPVVRFYNKLTKRPFIKVEQIQRLNEHKAFDYVNAADDFGYAPRSYEEGVMQQVQQMRSVGAIRA